MKRIAPSKKVRNWIVGSIGVALFVVVNIWASITVALKFGTSDAKVPQLDLNLALILFITEGCIILMGVALAFSKSSAQRNYEQKLEQDQK